MTTSEWRDASLARRIGELASAYFPEFARTGQPAAGAASDPQLPVGATTTAVEAQRPPAAGGPSVPGFADARLQPTVAVRAPGWPEAFGPGSAPTTPGAAPAGGVSPTLVQLGRPEGVAAQGQGGQGPGTASGPGRPNRRSFVGARSVDSIREDFPILSEVVDGKPLVWLDNAATTQRPRAVIDRLVQFYEHENSNVHRGAHALAARSTDAYEGARSRVADFIGAGSPEQIVFVRGTTEGINLVARSFVKPRLAPGDEIVLTQLEHHANIVPWQIIAAETGAVLKIAPVDERGQILLGEYSALFTPRTRFASFAHVSNALGTITPAAEMTAIAHARGVPVLLDAAQSVSHLPLDVNALDVDFLVFSGHKIFGPTGIGAVYGKEELLEAAEPYQGGGNMIADVTFARTVYQHAPAKFEAGTGNIADAVGLGAALDYVSGIGLENIAAYEHSLLRHGEEVLSRIPGVHLVGTAAQKASILSFVLDGHPVEEVGQALSHEGIATRAGHHCAQPVLRHFGLEATVRPSLAFYNTYDELDALGSVVARLAGHPELA